MSGGFSTTIEVGSHVNFRLSKDHRKRSGTLQAVINGIIKSIDSDKGELIIIYTGKIKDTGKGKDRRIVRRLIEVVKYNTEYTLPDNLKPALMRQEADKESWSSSEDEELREMKRKFLSSSDEDEKENRPQSKRSKIDQLWAKATNRGASQESAEEPIPPTQGVFPSSSTQEVSPSTQDKEVLPVTQEVLPSTRELPQDEESYTTPSSSPTIEMSTQETDAKMRALIMPMMSSGSQQASQPASQPLFSQAPPPSTANTSNIMPSQGEASPPPSPSPAVNNEYSVNLMSDMDQLTEEDDVVMKAVPDAEVAKSSKPNPKNKGKAKKLKKAADDIVKKNMHNVTVTMFDKGGQKTDEESELGSDTSQPGRSNRKRSKKEPALKKASNKMLQNMTVVNEANIIDSDGQEPKSLAQEGAGVRRSKRMPKTGLDRNRGDKFLYDNNRTCIGVQKVSIDVLTRTQCEDIWQTKKPTKEQAMEIGIQWYKNSEWDRKKTKLYESDEYDEWQSSQHRSKRKSLRKIGSDDEGSDSEVEQGTPPPTQGEVLGALLDSSTEYEFSEEEESEAGSTSSSSDGLVILTKKQMQRRKNLEKARLEKSRATVKSKQEKGKKKKKKKVYNTSDSERDSESDSEYSDEASESDKQSKKKVCKSRRSSQGNLSKADKKNKSASKSKYNITKEPVKSSKPKASRSRKSTGSGSGKSKAGKKNPDYSSSDEDYQPKIKTPPKSGKSKSDKSKASQNKSSKSKKENIILNTHSQTSESESNKEAPTKSKKKLPAKSSKSKPGESSIEASQNKSSKSKKNIILNTHSNTSESEREKEAPTKSKKKLPAKSSKSKPDESSKSGKIKKAHHEEKDDFSEFEDFFAVSGNLATLTQPKRSGQGDNHPERSPGDFSGADDEVSMAQANEHSTSEDGEPPVVVDLVAVAKERTDQIHNQLLLEFPHCDVSVEPLDTNQGEKNLGAGWFIMFEDEFEMMIEGLFVLGPNMVRNGVPTGDNHGLWLTLKAGEGIFTVDNTDHIMCPGVVYGIVGSEEWHLKNTSLTEPMRVYFEGIHGQ